jgi:hypothetical protein
VGWNSISFTTSSFGDPAMLLRNGLQYNPAALTAVNYNPGIRPSSGQLDGPSALVDANGGRPPRISQWSIGLQREITKDLVVEARRPQLPRGNVDRDLEVDTARFPRLDLPAHLIDHPLADDPDQSELLGERDEIQGRDQIAVLGHPADQCLDAPHMSVRQIDDGLVVQHPALSLDRVPKLRGET